MASRSSYLKSKIKSRGEDVELVPVRSNVLYGIQTKPFDQQKSSIERNIKVIPNITFYDNYTKAFIDFSDYLNNPETSDIKSFFSNLINGLNFTISDAVWGNSQTDKLQYDLSGTYKFIKLVDNIVFVEIISIESYSDKITRYDKTYFEKLPIFKLSTIITPDKKEIKSYIFNHLGKNSKNSFAYMGTRVGDYIQIQNKDTKYQINSYETDSEGKETLTVIGSLPTEDNIGTPILFTLCVNNFNKIQLNYDNNTLGKCELIINDKISECLNNHTELQAKLRENSFNKTVANFFPGEFCETQEINATEILNKAIVKSINNRNTNVIRNPISTGISLTTSRTDFFNNLFG